MGPEDRSQRVHIYYPYGIRSQKTIPFFCFFGAYSIILVVYMDRLGMRIRRSVRSTLGGPSQAFRGVSFGL